MLDALRGPDGQIRLSVPVEFPVRNGPSRGYRVADNRLDRWFECPISVAEQPRHAAVTVEDDQIGDSISVDVADSKIGWAIHGVRKGISDRRLKRSVPIPQ